MKFSIMFINFILLVIASTIAVIPLFNGTPYSYANLTPVSYGGGVIKANQYLPPTISKAAESGVVSPNISWFNFNYSKSGGIVGLTYTISYNSKTNELIFYSDQNTFHKQLSVSEKKNLEDVIIKNKDKFFKTLSDYPPITGAADFFSYRLSININNNTHTTSWTDASAVPVPDIVFEIADIIEKV
jgi:hypothetical protein